MKDIEIRDIGRRKRRYRHALYALHKCLYMWKALNEQPCHCKSNCSCKIRYITMTKQPKIYGLCAACQNLYENMQRGEDEDCNNCILTGFAWMPGTTYSWSAGKECWCEQDDCNSAYYPFFENNGGHAYLMVDCIQRAIAYYTHLRIRGADPNDPVQHQRKNWLRTKCLVYDRKKETYQFVEDI